MSVINYKINGTANVQPLKDTEKATEGMFKKIENIDNKLKAFVGIRVFQEVNKIIKESLNEYDKFKASLKEELNISKQMDSFKKTFSATIGTIRDEIFSSLNNVFSNDSLLGSFKDLIPKIGANLIASMKVVEKIVINIKNNFQEIIKKETWNDFFNHAKNLANNFCTLFASLLKDVFSFGIEFFKKGFENMNIFSLLWTPARTFFGKIVEVFRGLGSNIAPWLDDSLKNEDEKTKRYLQEMPRFSFSDSTTKAFSDFGKTLGSTISSALNTLAGEDVNALYNREYQNALNKLSITIAAMEKSMVDNTKEMKELLEAYKKGKSALIKDNLQGVTKGFNDSTSRINGILGNADSNAIQKIREQMNVLNEQFEASSKNIEKLSEQLKEAKTIQQVDSIFDSINQNIANMVTFTSGMDNLEKESKKARTAFDLLEGSLKSIGQLGQVIESIMTKNWIGMLITLIARLASTFSNLSENAAAMQNILDVLFDIIEDMLSDLGDSLDTIFKPLLDISVALGQVIGSLLRLVINFITPLANIINNFNFLIPILNVVSLLISGVADAFGYLHNFLSEFIKNITFGAIDFGKMNTNNYQKALDAISQENSYQDYQNNSSSYNVGGDIYINIYFEHSFVNGDSREIALALRDEIRLAENNGY
jgi:hypothetical protein